MITRRSFCASMMLLPSAAMPASPLIVKRSYASPDPYRDVFGYWRMDEASGSRRDATGRNNLTENGTVPQVAGKNACAAYSTDDANYLSTSAVDFKLGEADFTWSFWASVAAINAGGSNWALSQGAGGTTDVGIYCGCGGASWAFGFSSTETDWVVATATGAPQYGIAEHFVGIVSSRDSVVSFYRNGVAYSAAKTITFNTPTNDLHILKYYPGFDLNLNGWLDELCFWKRALSSNEVKWLYNNGSGRFI